MLISQYEVRTGKEKVIANEEEMRRGPEKRCVFKDSVSYVPGLATVSAKKKKAKKDPVVFYRPPPS